MIILIHSHHEKMYRKKAKGSSLLTTLLSQVTSDTPIQRSRIPLWEARLVQNLQKEAKDIN